NPQHVVLVRRQVLVLQHPCQPPRKLVRRPQQFQKRQLLRTGRQLRRFLHPLHTPILLVATNVINAGNLPWEPRPAPGWRKRTTDASLTRPPDAAHQSPRHTACCASQSGRPPASHTAPAHRSPTPPVAGPRSARRKTGSAHAPCRNSATPPRPVSCPVPSASRQRSRSLPASSAGRRPLARSA